MKRSRTRRIRVALEQQLAILSFLSFCWQAVIELIPRRQAGWLANIAKRCARKRQESQRQSGTVISIGARASLKAYDSTKSERVGHIAGRSSISRKERRQNPGKE